jgi:hypothetical protein
VKVENSSNRSYRTGRQTLLGVNHQAALEMVGQNRGHMDSEESKHRQSTKGVAAKEGRYANFFQVGHNAFEFLLEFGQQDRGIHTRIYVSPQYARVLSDLLIETLRQHEREFGVKPDREPRPS